MSDDLPRQIEQLGDWYYEFELDGRKTPLKHADSAIRHPRRKAYFFQPMLDLFGGSLAGQSVLDLGCNQGYFSLAALEAGCDRLLGIDAAKGNIDRASLVLKTRGIDPARYELRRENFFEAFETFERTDSFDVVLALGIVHWMEFTDHIRLLREISRLNTDVLLIDMTVSLDVRPTLELRRDSFGPRDPQDDENRSMRMLPTPIALVWMAEALGYRGVVLKPEFDDWTGSEDYRTGARRAFLFAKQTSLEVLNVPTEPPVDSMASAAMDLSGRDLVRALVGKVLRKVGLRGNR